MSMIRCFSALILLCQQVTHYKIICRFIIVTDVKMTLKRASFQKVKVLLNSTTEKGGFT